MWHDLELSCNLLANMRVIVPVARCPPGCDAIDEFPAICQYDSRAMRRDNRQAIVNMGKGGIRWPEVSQPVKPFWLWCLHWRNIKIAQHITGSIANPRRNAPAMREIS